jgi:aryl-alcohol dehydrogenase-like predicted oxidoreductase
MQTVTLGAPRLEVTPAAHGTGPFGGERGPAGERAAIEATGPARSPGISFSGTAQARGPGQVTQTRAARC